MRRIPLGVLVTVALSGSVSAQEIHAPQCLYGCPIGSPASNDLIFREIYILSSNDTTKFADWVAYKVTKDTIGPTAERRWKPDPDLAENETLEPNDYRGAHAELETDRGHQVPLASFTSTEHWETTNYLSNITPQKSDLNQGPWVRLEGAVRNLAKADDVAAVYVMTGTLYERDMPDMPEADEDHKVPSGYWKIISVDSDEGIKVAVFEFDQETSRGADFCAEQFVSGISTIEAKTGLTFFHGLGQQDRDELVAQPSKLLSELGCEP